FSDIPFEWKRWPRLQPPVELNDPSEAIRSSAILPAVRRLFSIIEERPYGGQLVSVILPQLDRSRVPPAELDRLILDWLSPEDDELRHPLERIHRPAILASSRRGVALLAGKSRGFAVRVGLAMRYRLLPALRLRYPTPRRSRRCPGWQLAAPLSPISAVR